MNLIGYFKNFIEIISLFQGTGILFFSIVLVWGVRTLQQHKIGENPPVPELTENDPNYRSRKLSMSFNTTFLKLSVDTKKESHPIAQGRSSRNKKR